MYAWERAAAVPAQTALCTEEPQDSPGISSPAARGAGASGGLRLLPGPPPPPPLRELRQPGGARPAGGQHHGGHVLRRGLAPQLGAGWSRDRATWSGADKGPLGSRTRHPRELVPSWDSWERGSNLHRQPVPRLELAQAAGTEAPTCTGSRYRSDAASLPHELHQVGSLQTCCAPEPRAAGVCGEGWGCASLLSALPTQTPREGTLNLAEWNLAGGGLGGVEICSVPPEVELILVTRILNQKLSAGESALVLIPLWTPTVISRSCTKAPMDS